MLLTLRELLQNTWPSHLVVPVCFEERGTCIQQQLLFLLNKMQMTGPVIVQQASFDIKIQLDCEAQKTQTKEMKKHGHSIPIICVLSASLPTGLMAILTCAALIITLYQFYCSKIISIDHYSPPKLFSPIPGPQQDLVLGWSISS